MEPPRDSHPSPWIVDRGATGGSIPAPASPNKLQAAGSPKTSADTNKTQEAPKDRDTRHDSGSLSGLVWAAVQMLPGPGNERDNPDEAHPRAAQEWGPAHQRDPRGPQASTNERRTRPEGSLPTPRGDGHPFGTAPTHPSGGGRSSQLNSVETKSGSAGSTLSGVAEARWDYEGVFDLIAPDRPSGSPVAPGSSFWDSARS